MKRTALTTIVMLLFSGCTLGPDYLRPKLLIPDNHRGVVGAPAAESIADLPWWEVFKDSTLQELTREALSNNYDLQTAAARVSFETAVKLFPETEPGIMSLSRLQSLDNAPAPATPTRKP